MKTFLKTLLVLTLATAFLLTGCETPDVSGESFYNKSEISSETASDIRNLTSSTVSKDGSNVVSSVDTSSVDTSSVTSSDYNNASSGSSSNISEDSSHEISSDNTVFAEKTFTVTEDYPEMGRHLASVDVTISLPSGWNPIGHNMIYLYDSNGIVKGTLNFESKWFYENNPMIISAKIISKSQLTINERTYDAVGYQTRGQNKENFYRFTTSVGRGEDQGRLYINFLCETVSDEQQEYFVEILRSMTISNPYYKDYSQVN